MKVFNDASSWGGKVNFVDDNNVFVGYDMGQSCCEHADWFINDNVYENIDTTNDGYEKTELDLEGYNFDTGFFLESNAHCYDGAMAIFRLTNGEGGVKYLHLFNVHNGYYGHGFEMAKDGSAIHNGTL